MIRVCVMGLVLGMTGAAWGQQGWDPNVFHWVTIGDLKNIPYPGGPSGQLAGCGSVAHRYTISKYEVTTAQWMEFVNTYSTKGDPWKFFADPSTWGGDPGSVVHGRGSAVDARPE